METRQKLVESYVVNGSNLKKIPLTESTKIIEKDGKEYKCRAAYELPVWRLGEKNLNERIYSKELAEKLIKENPVTLGLANHPENEADVTYTFAVERNPHIKENILYVDAYLVGDNGELANEIIEAGGNIGLSSSAYGDVDSEGRVQLEGFEIERFCDWVEMPSYGVYAGKENAIGSEKNKESFSNSNTNIIIEKEEKGKKENKNMSTENKETSKTKSLEEKNLRLGVRNLFKEAENKESLQEKLEVYKEVIDYCGDSEFGEDYVKKAAEKIEEIQQELYELADKGKEVDELKENSEKTHKELEEKVETLEKEKSDLQEQYEMATQLLDDMKTRESKIKEMYEMAIAEKNGMVSAEEYQELAVYLKGKEEKLEELLEENRRLKKRIRFYMQETMNRNRVKEVNGDEKEDEDEEDEEREEDKDKKKESSFVRKSNREADYRFVRDNKQVRDYYEDLLLENPNVEKIKEEILGCGTLFEAQKKYLNLKDLVEDIPNPNSIKRLRMSNIEEEDKQLKNRKTRLTIREGWV